MIDKNYNIKAVNFQEKKLLFLLYLKRKSSQVLIERILSNVWNILSSECLYSVVARMLIYPQASVSCDWGTSFSLLQS
jgi:hypothetical protein